MSDRPDLEALEKLARDAEPYVYPYGGHLMENFHEDVQDHIAACDPTTILSLIAYARRVERERDHALKERDAEVAHAALMEEERDEALAGQERLIRAVTGGDPDADRLSAICTAEALRLALAALRVANKELEWGHREMRGRPPQHWLDALEEVRNALSHSALLTHEPEEE